MDIRKIQPYDVILVHKKFVWYNIKTWLAKIIQIVSGSKYNHVAIVVKFYNELYVVESLACGTMMSAKLEDYINEEKYQYKILRYCNIKNPSLKELVIYNIKTIIGKKYDFSSLVLFKLLQYKTGLWFGKRHEDAFDRLYCWEAVAYSYKFLFDEWWKINIQDIERSTYFDQVI